MEKLNSTNIQELCCYIHSSSPTMAPLPRIPYIHCVRALKNHKIALEVPFLSTSHDIYNGCAVEKQSRELASKEVIQPCAI